MSVIKALKRFVIFLFFLLLSCNTFAQTDSLDNGKSAKDSVIYTHLKERMKKHRVTNEIYGFLFRDVYNVRAGDEVKAIEVNHFAPFKGKVIGNITIKVLDVFGPTVYDTTRKGNTAERLINRNLHTNTRTSIVRNSYLLFHEGDYLDPKVMQDNERLIRKNPTIHDARIMVLERKDVNWMVDILVIVQDVWSISADVSVGGFKNFGLTLGDANFQGRGHSFKNSFSYNQLDPYQKFQFSSIYTIPYIEKTFITGQAEFTWNRDLHREAIRFFRPFLTTETKYAGSFEVGHTKTREFKRLIINKIDSLLVYPTSFNYYDVWIGRSFKLPKNSFLSKPNARLIVAARSTQFVYQERPLVTPDSNIIYWNRITNLISVGYSDRNYRRDLLIYGFGRTEDVPIGMLFSMTGGWENTQFGQRAYGGIQYARGDYLPKNKGYFYNLFNFGGYVKGREIQQGVFSLESDYISPLMRHNHQHFRQFVTLKYTLGIHRDDLEYLNISNKEGITGVNSDYLRGDKRLTLGLETVMFSPKTLLGFRAASFIFADLGLVSLQNIALTSSPIYQGYGLGLRLRNENLTFSTVQIRIGYYPNIPNLGSSFRFGLDGVQPLKLRDFDITAPSLVPLR